MFKAFLSNQLAQKLRISWEVFVEKRRHNKYQHIPLAQVFHNIYLTNEWGEGGFNSGAGSHDPELIVPYIEAVQNFLNELPQRPVIIDLGSGDFNVGINFVSLAEAYIACDIVEDLQRFNREQYVASNLKFVCLDISNDELPDGDVVFIRQVLQHLSNMHINRVLEKCRKYSKWVITEHIPDSADFCANIDITAGCGTRLLLNSGVVITEPPFSVAGYNERILCNVRGYGGVVRTVLYEKDAG